jgi:hypothetical protein
MGQFKPGEDPRRNMKGRPAGTPNKTTEELRASVQRFIENNWDSIQEDFDKLKASERLNFINSLLRHVIPLPISYEKLSESQLEDIVEYLSLKNKQDETKNNE